MILTNPLLREMLTYVHAIECHTTNKRSEDHLILENCKHLKELLNRLEKEEDD